MLLAIGIPSQSRGPHVVAASTFVHFKLGMQRAKDRSGPLSHWVYTGGCFIILKKSSCRSRVGRTMNIDFLLEGSCFARTG